MKEFKVLAQSISTASGLTFNNGATVREVNLTPEHLADLLKSGAIEEIKPVAETPAVETPVKKGK